MARRRTIEVELSVERALDLIVDRFTGAPRKGSRRDPSDWAKFAWTIERDAAQLCIYPSQSTMVLFEPVPDPPTVGLIETTMLRVDARALEGGGARIEAGLGVNRKRVAGLAATIVGDLFAHFGVLTLSNTIMLNLTHRRARRRARDRLLGMAIEPLVPHERDRGSRGPFRRE